MGTATQALNIDLAALEAEVAKLSPEEIQKQLIDIRTKQRVNQSKHQGSDAQKLYMKKRSEMVKLMAKKAKELGVYDQILETAKTQAKELIASRAVESESVPEFENA